MTAAQPPRNPSRPTVADTAEDDKRLLAEAERALADRPNFNISLRIGLIMLLCFLMVAVGTARASLNRTTSPVSSTTGPPGGAVDFIPKPFKMSQLRDLVMRLVAEKATKAPAEDG